MKIELPKSWDLSAQYAIVIPAYDELMQTVHMAIASCDPGALVVLVVNRSPTSPWSVVRSNEKLLNDLPLLYSSSSCDAGLTLCAGGKLPKLLLVDCSSEGREIQGGVGKARRIGCDIVFDLQSVGKIKSEWIHNTDADSVMPRDYFQAAEDAYQDGGRSALCMRGIRGFTSNPDNEHAVDLDQLQMCFVNASISRTKAPWPTMISGCGLGISHWAYYKVGGIQPYGAREDGHLINAAGKLGLIHRIYGQRLLTEARDESRTGVGYASTIAKVHDAIARDGDKPKLLFNPATYGHTDAFYRTIEHLLVQGSRLDESLQQGCVEAFEHWGFPVQKERVREALFDLVGPIDTMFRHLSPRDAYLAVNKSLDLRGTMRVVYWFGRKLWENVDWSEGLRAAHWLSASRHSEDLGKALHMVLQDEETYCKGIWGPMAGAERLFGPE